MQTTKSPYLRKDMERFIKNEKTRIRRERAKEKKSEEETKWKK